MRISDWSSDVCSSDLGPRRFGEEHRRADDGAAEREAAAKITTFAHAGDTYDAAAGLQAGANISRFARAAQGHRGRNKRGRARARPIASRASAATSVGPRVGKEGVRSWKDWWWPRI